MKSKNLLVAIALASLTGTSLFAATRLTAGKYQASITPAMDSKTADQIEKSLESIQGLTSADVSTKNQSLSFKVEEGQSIDLAQLRDAVKAVAPDAQLGQPQLKDADKSTRGTSGMSNADYNAAHDTHSPKMQGSDTSPAGGTGEASPR